MSLTTRHYQFNLAFFYIRFSTEERLQQMWNQMAVEMGALAEDKTVEDRVREGLLKWMQQFPSVVQNIHPKSSGKMTSCFLNSLM